MFATLFNPLRAGCRRLVSWRTGGPPPWEVGEATIVGMTLSANHRLPQVQRIWGTRLNRLRVDHFPADDRLHDLHLGEALARHRKRIIDEDDKVGEFARLQRAQTRLLMDRLGR